MSWNRRAVVWLAAIVVVVNGFFPAVWILLTSFKTETELSACSDHLSAGRRPTLANYSTAFTAQPILRFMWNSLVVATLSTRAVRVRRRARRLRADAAPAAAAAI